MAHQTLDVWTYREGVDLGVSTRSVVGYDVEARDGSIGKVDEATFDTDSSSLVIDTGPWIFGKKVMLPAGVIRQRRPRGREDLCQPHQGRDQERPGVR